MKDKEIRTPADLAGLKIRVAGADHGRSRQRARRDARCRCRSTQVYNALQTGLIDGVITGASTLSDFKLDEVANSLHARRRTSGAGRSSP